MVRTKKSGKKLCTCNIELIQQVVSLYLSVCLVCLFVCLHVCVYACGTRQEEFKSLRGRRVEGIATHLEEGKV